MRVEKDVLNVLDAANKIGNQLVLIGQLDRALYTKTNKVLEAAGGKWNRSAKAHLFDGDASDRVEQIILTGEIEIPKDEFDFFPTPPDVVGQLMDLADVRPGMKCLEPSGGHGAIADELKKRSADVEVVELNAANAEVLRGKGHYVIEMDFLSMEPDAEYDVCVMNPPFSKQADIKHVNHALKFLKPGGLLVAVMPSSVTFRQNKLTTDFRGLVEARGGSIEALPGGSFKASGTMVNTVIVTIPAE